MSKFRRLLRRNAKAGPRPLSATVLHYGTKVDRNRNIEHSTSKVSQLRRQPKFDVQYSMLAAQSRPTVSGLNSSNLAWGEHSIAPARVPQLF
jgi:hypothetical protein